MCLSGEIAKPWTPAPRTGAGTHEAENILLISFVQREAEEERLLRGVRARAFGGQWAGQFSGFLPHAAALPQEGEREGVGG